MVFGIAMVVAACALTCADATSNHDAVQGTWQLSSGEADGNVLSEAELKNGILVIDGDHYTFKMDNSSTLTGTQKLGTMKGLKTIDIMDGNGDNKEKTCLGIYQVVGDEFRVIFSLPGKDRPSKFETAPGSGQWMHVWKHVKE